MQTIYSSLDYATYALGRCVHLTDGYPRCRSRPTAGSRYCKKHKRLRDQEAAILAKERRQGAIARSLWPCQGLINVYFVQCDDQGQKPIKIGVTHNVQQRMADLQIANAYPIRFLASFVGVQMVERQLHKALAEHRLSGEWFKPCPEIEILVALANENRLENIKRFLDS